MEGFVVGCCYDDDAAAAVVVDVVDDVVVVVVAVAVVVVDSRLVVVVAAAVGIAVEHDIAAAGVLSPHHKDSHNRFHNRFRSHLLLEHCLAFGCDSCSRPHRGKSFDRQRRRMCQDP